ncbi:MAG TPA: hypothetical protein VGB92_00940 [Longimicrobium sp.]|jgi:hypothetical protein
MMQTILAGALVLFAGAAPAAGAGTDAFCSIHPPIKFSAARTRHIVRSAEVVVRAVAVGSATGRTLKRFDADTLAFEVREVLKGRSVPDTIRFYGVVADWDDFQEGPVPYLSHRLRYSEGDCINAFYRIGAEYLLLLGRQPGNPRLAGLTPYWQLLAPTNDQIRGPDDPWLKWVRLQLRPTAPAAAPARRRRAPGPVTQRRSTGD